MYHVSKNIRTQKTAQLICEGLAKCLEEKPFKLIRVNEICDKSFVSRATFYRLFDNTLDILAYECDTIFEERIKISGNKTFSEKKERALFAINIWLNHRSFVKALAENNLSWILLETHAKYAEQLKKVYAIPFEDDKKSDYFISILSSFICSAISVYFMHNESEPIEEVYETICDCIIKIEKAIA